MKKFSLLLMIVLIVGAIFISCSAEPSADASSVANVAIDFPKALSAEATTIDHLPGADTLTWKYTAVKDPNGGGFTTGQVSVQTPIRADGNTGLPYVIGQKEGSTNDNPKSDTWFSTGNWKFSFYGYDSNNSLIYEAVDVAVTVNRPAENSNSNIGGTANIRLSIANDPRGNCKVKMGEIFVSLGNGYVSDATYTLYVYDNDTALDINGETEGVDGIVGNKSNSDKKVTFTYSSDLFSYEDSGLHLVKFEVKKNSETLAYASGEIGIWARKGYTWTISGDLDSLDSLAQVGIHVDYIPTDANQTPSTITIGSEAELRAFASFVNQGNNCEGLTIELTSDITLTSAWTPIGNSYRGQVGEKVPYFAGTFDGRKPDDSVNYTISGLTDGNNYVPANAKTNGEYSYGLFGIVKNATIKNINLTNVDIKSNNASYTADEVGAVVGYSLGSLTLDNITVSGSVVGDSVGGIIGRAYGTSAENETIVISNCTNQATVSSSHIHDSGANSYTDRAAGIAGYINGLGTPVTVENCTNNGIITVGSENVAGTNYIAGICCYGFNTNVKDSYTFTSNKSTGNLTVLGTSGVARVASIVYMCNEPKETTDTYSFTDASNYNVGTITVFGTPRTDVSKETH